MFSNPRSPEPASSSPRSPDPSIHKVLSLSLSLLSWLSGLSSVVLVFRMSTSRTGSLGSMGDRSMHTIGDDQPHLWKYVTNQEKLGGGNTRFKCNYCQCEYKGVIHQVDMCLVLGIGDSTTLLFLFASFLCLVVRGQ